MNTEFKNIAEYGFIRPHIGYAVNNKYVDIFLRIVFYCKMILTFLSIKNTEMM